MNELKKEFDELISKIFEIENKNFKDDSSYASFAAKLVLDILSRGGGIRVVDFYDNIAGNTPF